MDMDTWTFEEDLKRNWKTMEVVVCSYVAASLVFGSVHCVESRPWRPGGTLGAHTPVLD